VFLVLTLLRVMHIVGGVFWAGAAMTLYGFVVPTAAATRPESSRFMQHLAGASGLSAWMTIAAIVTTVAGLALASPLGGAVGPGFMHTPRGIALALGMLLGLGAFLEGMFVTMPAANGLGELGRAAAANGGKLDAGQSARLEALRTRMVRAGTRGAWMLGITATLMAAARLL
jgi:hypothetical protein